MRNATLLLAILVLSLIALAQAKPSVGARLMSKTRSRVAWPRSDLLESQRPEATGEVNDVAKEPAARRNS